MDSVDMMDCCFLKSEKRSGVALQL